MPLIESANLRKSFGDTEVLRGLTFRVEPGEFVCVWGPSGAGKSTLLHVLGLMTPPSGGALSLFGEDVSGLTARKSAGISARNPRGGPSTSSC